ncbi:pyruvate kinase [Paenibacillus flagellatus]|uniref:Pyruvate kinase n=1 Tax=Paenibacillus flagellatus TaxID=2211139 RepID=A0A2V5JXM6_9BACL|nr:pyruvate kinase [Paenibacillus flagellatus]PYI51609.1 pyruvate kinase [Paenibacillus flagellatus]
MRKTKIVCTMGPSCDSVDVLKDMIRAGMNVARMNMAHGSLEDHAARIERVRRASEETGVYVAVLMDIKGPEVRIGTLAEPFYDLAEGGTLILTTEQVAGDGRRVSVNYPDLPRDVKPGSRILIDDGLIGLEVEQAEGTEVVCRIVNGGRLKPRKGVNLPGIRTSLPGVTERDVQHIAFGVEQKVDIIAASFVRKAADIVQIRELLEGHGAGHVKIVSKIENEEGVENLSEILAVSDGIMVARGDLGVEIPVEDVPIVQKQMIRACNAAGKPVITATHMLESMQANPRPTRAEASDVSNAVLDGTDAVMLSGETAAGKYPVESVATMAAIVCKTESILPYRESFERKIALHPTNVTEVISQSVVGASLDLTPKAIVAPTETGFTARMISKYRPEAPIIAVTTNAEVLGGLALVWGVVPVQGKPEPTTDEVLASSLRSGVDAGLLQPGDTVIVSAGVPVGRSGATNLMKIVEVPA